MDRLIAQNTVPVGSGDTAPATGTPGQATSGNPATNTPATPFPAYAFNALQEELIAILVGAGVTPDRTNNAQIVGAIKRLVQNQVVLTDTGTANVYAAANTPALTVATWANGITQQIKVANTNTGASTYSPDTLTAIPIYGLGLQPLQGGEMFAGGTAIMMKQTIAGVNSGNPICVLMECAGGAQQIAPGAQPGHAAQLSQIATVRGAFRNLTASATGTNATVTIAADELVVESVATPGTYTTLRGVAVSINSATVGANGIDTGALAASTWYAKHVIYNPTTGVVAGLLSPSATAPMLPAGYTQGARTGWIRTDSTANKYPLSFLQYGRQARYKAVGGSNVAAYPAMASGSSGTPGSSLTAVSVSSFVPPTAFIIKGFAWQAGASGTSTVQVSPNSTATSYGGNGVELSQNGSASANQQVQFEFMLESASIFYAATLGSSAGISCTGWEDALS